MNAKAACNCPRVSQFPKGTQISRDFWPRGWRTKRRAMRACARKPRGQKTRGVRCARWRLKQSGARRSMMSDAVRLCNFRDILLDEAAARKLALQEAAPLPHANAQRVELGEVRPPPQPAAKAALPAPDLLTPREAAAKLHCSIKTLNGH